MAEPQFIACTSFGNFYFLRALVSGPAVYLYHFKTIFRALMFMSVVCLQSELFCHSLAVILPAYVSSPEERDLLPPGQRTIRGIKKSQVR